MPSRERKSDIIDQSNLVGSQRPDNLETRLERPRRYVKSVDLTSPSVDRMNLIYLDRPIRILEMASIIEGNTSPTVTWNVEYSDDTTNFTSLFNSNQTTSSTTTTQMFYPDVKQVPQKYWLWFDLVSKTGTIDHFDLTIIYEQ